MSAWHLVLPLQRRRAEIDCLRRQESQDAREKLYNARDC
jgi:hypothetical protein